MEVSRAEECVGCRLCAIGCPDLALYIEGVDSK